MTPASVLGPAFALLSALLLLPLAVWAGEAKNQEEERRQIACNFELYDFEIRGNDPRSRDRDGDGWPDYWILVKDEKHKSYPARDIRIVPDDTVEGRRLYRNQPGHVLRVPFDGTPVALATLYPKTIDPQLAYEVSAWARTEGLFDAERYVKMPKGSTPPPSTLVRVRLVWLYVEAESEREIGPVFVLPLDPGQEDWAEAPAVRRINDLPVDTKTGLRPNAVRVMLEIEDNPAVPGADRHGVVWFDDIRIRSRPKLRIDPVFHTALPSGKGPRRPVILDLLYQGLIENIPDPKNPGGYKGKAYSRSLQVTDIYGEPPLDAEDKPIRFMDREIDPGPRRAERERIRLPLRKLGVYYATVALKGHDGGTQAQVTQAVILWQKPRVRNLRKEALADARGSFGVRIDAPPLHVLREQQGLLADLVQRIGVYQVKTNVWPQDFKPEEEAQPYLLDLSRELRRIRSIGAHVTGVIANTPHPFRQSGMQHIMREKTALLNEHLRAVMPYVRSHVEFWQWGVDDDTSFSTTVNEAALRQPRSALDKMAAATAQAYPVNLTLPKAVLPDPEATATVALRIPASMGLDTMVRRLSALLPRYFIRLRGKDRYPPPYLLDLAPKLLASGERVADPDTLPLLHDIWLSVALQPVPSGGRDATSEREQVEDLTTKAIVAKALGIPRIDLGSLFDTTNGLCAFDASGQPVPRPAFLAIRTLEEYLSGSRYIGSFQLRDQFPNYVFQHRDRDRNEVIVAIWYDGPGRSADLDRLYFGDMGLQVVDMAGNVRPLQQKGALRLRHMPVLVTGISLPLALTRMSIEIADVPPLLASHKLQRQELRVTNYFPSQLPLTMQFRYAANSERFKLERGWTVRPDRQKLDLGAPAEGHARPAGLLDYQVQPDPNSEIGVLLPDAAGQIGLLWPRHEKRGSRRAKSGEKYVQITADINTADAVEVKLLRKTRLTSDLHVELYRLKKPGTNRIFLQMRIKWIPQGAGPRRRELVLIPSHLKTGQLPDELPPVRVPAFAPDDDTKPAVTVEFAVPLPRWPDTRTWISLREEGGTRFFILDVTEVVKQPKR